MIYIKLFLDYLDAIEPLGDAERGRLFTALMQYARTGEAPQLGGNERFLFPMMRAQIDKDRADEQGISEVRRESGKRGAKAKLAKQANARFAKQNKQMPDLSNCAENAPSPSSPPPPFPPSSPPTPPVITPISPSPVLTSPPLEANASCAEPEAACAPPVIVLPLNDGVGYPVSVEQCQEWAGLYPAVDVIQQLRGMRGWLDANPQKRKTRRGIQRFINSWLAREQDQGGCRQTHSQNQQAGSGNVFLDMLRKEEAHGQN